jgi:hypothetical protein
VAAVDAAAVGISAVAAAGVEGPLAPSGELFEGLRGGLRVAELLLLRFLHYLMMQWMMRWP